MEKYEEWADLIEELDMVDDLGHTSRDFIISLLENKPTWLTSAQVEWLKNLKERYIGA